MNRKTILFYTLLVVLLILSSGLAEDLYAQCSLCRLQGESSLANGGTEAKGLNKGILYLLLTPYLMIGGFAYFWWRNKKKEGEIA